MVVARVMAGGRGLDRRGDMAMRTGGERPWRRVWSWRWPHLASSSRSALRSVPLVSMLVRSTPCVLNCWMASARASSFS